MNMEMRIGIQQAVTMAAFEQMLAAVLSQLNRIDFKTSSVAS